MEAKNIYTAQDCTETGHDCDIKGKVVVIAKSVLPQDYPGQLFYCTGGNGANPNPIGRSVFMASLSDGEQSRWNRSDVVGVLKLELLPDAAKLHLSQIRPDGALDLKQNEPKYSGYSFLPDGRYTSGVWLCSEQEVMDYAEIQKPYQHRIMICDRNDFCVLEIVDGKLIYPTEEAMETFHQGQDAQSGGMTMT